VAQLALFPRLPVVVPHLHMSAEIRLDMGTGRDEHHRIASVVGCSKAARPAGSIPLGGRNTEIDPWMRDGWSWEEEMERWE
jgi:hypothetical protein